MHDKTKRFHIFICKFFLGFCSLAVILSNFWSMYSNWSVFYLCSLGSLWSEPHSVCFGRWNQRVGVWGWGLWEAGPGKHSGQTSAHKDQGSPGARHQEGGLWNAVLCSAQQVWQSLHLGTRYTEMSTSFRVVLTILCMHGHSVVCAKQHLCINFHWQLNHFNNF